ncbi:hypothetical protein SAMN04487950_3776 [Halogranum rubrum]|uniref:Uncharacterized protein n=1 Tax=Halogranum rubrum TaxID=553466 RepID=A0A1I4HST1_9EURY|nr:hypothetical protein [Halogranum rubrum]SFL44456.1 hypothetical protein SAMN04487950_3776 [Halogranum rubrum]
MSSVQETSEANKWVTRRQGVIGTITHSVTLCIALFGLVLFLAGFAMQTGVWAAIFAVWGTALVLFGATVYTLLWLQRR